MDHSLRRSAWWGPGSAAFLVIWLALLYFGREQLFRDPGTLWHTVVGERMLSEHAYIDHDPLSFTFESKPWIAQQWLGECAMALAHRAGGLDALLLLAATVLAATYAFIFGRLRTAGARPPVAALLIALVIAASSYHFHPRPHLASIAFMAMCYALVCDVEAGRQSPRRLLLLIPLFVAWTNLHGGALGGIVTVAIVILCWIGMMLVAAHGDPAAPRLRSRALGLFVLLIACAGSVFVNPRGAELPRVWLDLMKSGVVAKIMSEHAPLKWTSVEALMIGSLAACYIVVLATSWRRMLRVTWLLPLLWLALTVSRVRHGPLFAVLAVLSIAEMLPHSSLATSLCARSPEQTNRRVRSRVAPVAIAAFTLALAIQAAGLHIPLLGAGWARLNPRYWPVEAAPALREAIAKSGDPRVFNQMTFGGYLIYAVPEARVFIDDRCELYGDEFLMQYESLMNAPEEFDAVAATWPFPHVLVSARSKLAAHLADHADWHLIHGDATSVLYARKSAVPAN